MKWLNKYQRFLESNKIKFKVEAQNDFEKSKYKPTNLIGEICVGMLLLNNEFLDNILDRGLKARYMENSSVFLNDLKNLVMQKNRLRLGKFVSGVCVEDEEISNINRYFQESDFNIESDWNKLNDSRIISRNICDKLLVDQKLTEDLIKRVYWIGPNKTEDYSEDLVVELNSGSQFSLFINKNFTGKKTSSFNTFADDLIGLEIEKLHSDEYINKWDKLTQSWVKIIHKNAKREIQVHIEKFIDMDRVDSLGYFEYFDLKHRDMRFKNIGEHMREFDKNILYFSDLMSEIWKNREICFDKPEIVFQEWMEVKVFLLNSKILEHLLTESLVKNNLNEITKLDDGFKKAEGKIKMKFIKTIVDKIGCQERNVYYLGKKGNDFHQIPSRSFFRKFYNDIDIKFDYHVRLIIDNESEENNNFTIKVICELDKTPLLDFIIEVQFTGGEMSSKLGAKYNFMPSSDFNLQILNKISSNAKEEDY